MERLVQDTETLRSMKISVTKRELQSILSGYFKTNVTEVEVYEPSSELLNLLKAKIGVSISLAQKIPSIKSLRELCSNPQVVGVVGYSLGLAEAKWAVENWSQFLGFVESTGRIPTIGYNTGVLS